MFQLQLGYDESVAWATRYCNIGAGTAAAAPKVTNLRVSIVTGFQIDPGAVPGGFFQSIPMKATVGDEPGVAPSRPLTLLRSPISIPTGI